MQTLGVYSFNAASRLPQDYMFDYDFVK